MINEQTCVFFEQVTPGIREKNTYPGESFKNAYLRLKAIVSQTSDHEFGERESLAKVLACIERISELPNSAFIELNSIFEQELMHGELDN